MGVPITCIVCQVECCKARGHHLEEFPGTFRTGSYQGMPRIQTEPETRMIEQSSKSLEVLGALTKPSAVRPGEHIFERDVDTG